MKPFDLEAAKAGAPLVTRDGESVRFVAHVPDARETTRLIVVKPDGCLLSFCEDGKRSCSPDDGKNYLDLFMATVKRTVYVNFYNDGSAKHYDNPQMATMHASPAAIAVAVPVEIEE